MRSSTVCVAWPSEALAQDAEEVGLFDVFFAVEDRHGGIVAGGFGERGVTASREVDVRHEECSPPEWMPEEGPARGSSWGRGCGRAGGGWRVGSRRRRGVGRFCGGWFDLDEPGAHQVIHLVALADAAIRLAEAGGDGPAIRLLRGDFLARPRLLSHPPRPLAPHRADVGAGGGLAQTRPADDQSRQRTIERGFGRHAALVAAGGGESCV